MRTIATAALAALVAVGCNAQPGGHKQKAGEGTGVAPPSPVNCNELLSRVDCQSMVRAKLARPDTAEFSGLLLGDQVACGSDGSSPTYTSAVTSKNGLGVDVVTRFQCTINPRSRAMTLKLM